MSNSKHERKHELYVWHRVHARLARCNPERPREDARRVGLFHHAANAGGLTVQLEPGSLCRLRHGAGRRALCTGSGTGPGDRALEAAALADKAKVAGNTP